MRIPGIRLHFKSAEVASGLQLSVTGSLGFRTVHQVEPKAQLLLVANSRTSNDAVELPSIKPDVHRNASSIDGDDFLRHRRETCEASDVLMTPRFIEDDRASENAAQGEQNCSIAAAPLKANQQAVILAQCLFIEKSTPHDEMQRWEMAPYIEAVDSQLSSYFIIRCFCDILRIRWESTRSRTKERALLMMDKLVCFGKPHFGVDSTLTVPETEGTMPKSSRFLGAHIMTYLGRTKERMPRVQQSSSLPWSDHYIKDPSLMDSPTPLPTGVSVYSETLTSPPSCKGAQHSPPPPSVTPSDQVQGISGSSPGVAQRIYYSFGAYIPTIPALRNLLEKKAAAVELIRVRLSEMPNDPRLWCSLGDITRNDACYEKALEVSGNRSARAKRSLARSAYNRGDYEKSKVLWESAMALNSYYPDGWFALGAAALKARDVEKAMDAFTSAVQLDPENGEAWNNIACLRSSWQLWENFSHVAADVGNLSQASFLVCRYLVTCLSLCIGQFGSNEGDCL
ncbi:protein prenylyltransferase superfamily protein [Actinidia rufa]|uniref:Protein prenylyltransferase superfamily protein n=1 Tax=Actinidia rufa TaxID=165716 RepID=A0A7J0DYR1_9ERIC|nr:protein prenylyltransferase superfamily protein [Actinidia rufa]